MQTVTTCKEIEERLKKKLDIEFCTFKHYLFKYFSKAKASCIIWAFYSEVFPENYFFCSEKMKTIF